MKKAPTVSRDVPLLAAYEEVQLRFGTRGYLPIRSLRAALRRQPGLKRLTREGLDGILKIAPSLLPEYRVSYHPFSGPVSKSAGGLRVPGQDFLAGFLSILPRGKKEGT